MTVVSDMALKQQKYPSKSFYSSDLSILREGEEANEFWDILGGKETYATTERMIVSIEIIDIVGAHSHKKLFCILLKKCLRI